MERTEKTEFSMKALKITLKSVIMFFVFAFIALFLVRIIFADFYPKEMSSYVPSFDVKNKYSTRVDNLTVFTQEPLAPYDDAKEGNFFAKSVFVVPEEGEMQVCIRYNRSALENVAAFYKVAPETLEGDPLSVFDFVLHVKYDTEDGTSREMHYSLSYEDCFTDEFFVYRYVKLYFNGIDLTDAIWARVDIILKGNDLALTCNEHKFCIAIYEAYEFYDTDKEIKVEYPLVPYSLSEEEKRRV